MIGYASTCVPPHVLHAAFDRTFKTRLLLSCGLSTASLSASYIVASLSDIAKLPWCVTFVAFQILLGRSVVKVSATRDSYSLKRYM